MPTSRVDRQGTHINSTATSVQEKILIGLPELIL